MAAGLLVDGVGSQHRGQGLRLSNSGIVCDMRFWAWGLVCTWTSTLGKNDPQPIEP